MAFVPASTGRARLTYLGILAIIVCVVSGVQQTVNAPHWIEALWKGVLVLGGLMVLIGIYLQSRYWHYFFVINGLMQLIAGAVIYVLLVEPGRGHVLALIAFSVAAAVDALFNSRRYRHER